ncbi:MAG: adenosine kinase [Gammaproteobacteria bacterium]
MTTSQTVLGISNAIVDVLAHVEDDFLTGIGAPKGSMTLIDQERAEDIYGEMGPAKEMSGGSVANTIAGFASLGGRASYIGRVRDDPLGRIFQHDMQSLGVEVRLPPAADGAPTARSYILITPDGQRTMQTYLGASLELSGKDVTEQTTGRPDVMMLEGYVWDTPQQREAANNALQIAQSNNIAVVLSLSDDQCVDRHRSDFLDALSGQVRLIIADDSEVMRLFATDTLDEALDNAAASDTIFAVTRSEKGSVIVDGSDRIFQDAYPVDHVVDTTGAGDAYAAAFLYGWTSGRSLKDCAELGTKVATAVIQQVGPRLEKDVLADILER